MNTIENVIVELLDSISDINNKRRIL